MPGLNRGEERLSLTEELLAETVRLRISGELDLGTGAPLKWRLDELLAARQPVRLDCSGLGFVDSTGLQVLLTAALRFRAAGIAFAVEPKLQPQVVRLLALVRANDLLMPPAD